MVDLLIHYHRSRARCIINFFVVIQRFYYHPIYYSCLYPKGPLCFFTPCEAAQLVKKATQKADQL